MKPDGGPAFPTPSQPARMETYGGAGGVGGGTWFPTVAASPGMTLRDYFAAAFITGGLMLDRRQTTAPEVAELAYSVADAMLAERAK